jgi:type I restriction enzyme R subunit
MNLDSEAALETATLALFSQLKWETADCFDEVFGPPPGTARHPNLGRETTGEVALLSRLRPALQRLNPELSSEALTLAIEELTRDRSLVSAVQANRELYGLLKNGMKVKIADPEGGGETVETVRVIDWDAPANNDFLLASQLWITGDMYKRRTDLIGFVNGLPLVFVELKASHRQLKDAFDNNLRDYKASIPQLFWYNAFIILSNGSESVIGSITSEWDHFAEWKKIDDEGEEGVISLETMIRGTCDRARLLDIAENFILYKEARGGAEKLVAKNHQYLGVNNAVEAVRQSRENRGRLGVFWHTQGSGKSYSMVFFSQKVVRKLPGNWTFLVVTDRDDLDDQIYKNFADTGAVKEPEGQVRAASGQHLQQLLREDHQYVFTLIQKFHAPPGETYPKLSDRSDIIVMADEAHRSQYDVMALNMRNALPRAAFIGFTGTPLIAGEEERTRDVFGDYVSIYNFAQSVEDRATVPLYYENRIPELQLTNENLNRDIEQAVEEALLDEAQEARLEREFAREYHLITRDERLEKIAEDIVAHFIGRGQGGKAMAVCIDKATAVRMYDKVQKYWKQHLAILLADLETCEAMEREALQQQIDAMQTTDMAVVVSQSQNEIEDLKKRGADIVPHRKRLNAEDLETKFKDAKDPLRIVFVCAMWMTGFDAPACSTIYLDKPMANHTLMQTIARANRVFGDKVNGLIVDYIGVFRNLQKALAIYGSASGGGVAEGELPVKAKAALVEKLRQAIAGATAFCAELGVDLATIQHTENTFQRIRLQDDAMNAILRNDETRLKYLAQADIVFRLFRAILPDPVANEFYAARQVIVVLAQKIRALVKPADISSAMAGVEDVLDRSIKPEDGYVIHDLGTEGWIDLSKIDFKTLKKQFDEGRKRIEIEKLRGAINGKLTRLLQVNRTRLDFYDQFQKMIADYNTGASTDEAFFAQLVNFAQNLNQEEQRGIAERLDDEELALFDLLTKPALKLTKKERGQVKKIARDVLDTLKAERLVLDWRKKQQAKAAVRVEIEKVLERLPEVYTDELYQAKCQLVYQHIYDSYYGSGRSVYGVR